MKYLIAIIFLGIAIESIFVVGQQLDKDDRDLEKQSVIADNSSSFRRPTANFNGRQKRVLKIRKDGNQQSLPIVGRRLNGPSADSEADSVPASSIKKSFTVNNYDDNDNDDNFSRRRARFLFRQRVGK